MRCRHIYFTLLFCLAWLCIATDACGQCQATALVSPNSIGPLARYTVSVATTDRHCLAGGTFTITTFPPGAVVFPGGIDSFFDIFLEVSTDHHVRTIELTPLVAPGTPFQMNTSFTFDDPWYLPLFRSEQVWVNPQTGVFEFFRPIPPPMEIVPPGMALGQSFCFMVVHSVYTVPLAVPPGVGKPLISITPGCAPPDPCFNPLPCSPGGPFDYRADVLFQNGQWVLEFEYSNPVIEPACYCVSYIGNLPPFYDTSPLVVLDEREQEFTLSMASLTGFPACGEFELFSYPPGAMIESVPSPQFNVPGPMTTIAEVAVGRGSFLPGQEFRLAANIAYSDLCARADQEWIIERVLVQPDGRLTILDYGDECDPSIVEVPEEMDLNDRECIVVCHDVYYIQLNTPPEATPMITVLPGCEPPCEEPVPCVPGLLENCVYWTERIGSHWYLRFEYSNPSMEPVCYCINYEGVVFNSPEGYYLSAFDEGNQALHFALWGSSSVEPLSGTLTITETVTPGCEPDTHWIASFFDVFMEPFQELVPVPNICHPPGEAFQIVSEIVFDNPAVAPITYREWVMAGHDGMLHAYDDPEHPCIGDNVPPTMSLGQHACFVVCHRSYNILVSAPVNIGEPHLIVTPGCDPPCFNPFHCRPGAPTDYVYWFTMVGSDWILSFEYSNPFIEPVCYCVEVVVPPCSAATNLTILYRPPDTGDLGIQLNWQVSQVGMYIIYSTTSTNPTTTPPSPEWMEEGVYFASAPGPAQWSMPMDEAPYKNYVVVHNCDLGNRR